MATQTVVWRVETSAWIQALATAAGGGLGALVGANIAPAIESHGVYSAIPVCTGLVLGLLLASPLRPRAFSDALSRGVLVAGAAAGAGQLFASGGPLVLAAWPLLLLAVAVAIGVRPGSGWAKLARGAATSAAGGVGFLAFFGLLNLDAIQWEASPMLASLVAGSFVGLFGWFGTGLGGDDAPQGVAEERASLPAPFAEEHSALVATADRISSLLDDFETDHGDDAFCADVRGRVRDLLDEADRAMRRWQSHSSNSAQRRATRLSERISRNEERLHNESSPVVRAELDRAIARQRQSLSAIEHLDAQRRSFGVRLEQATAGLEMLELAVEDVVSGDDGFNSGAVDAITEALTEANAVLVDPPDAVDAVDASAEPAQPAQSPMPSGEHA